MIKSNIKTIILILAIIFVIIIIFFITKNFIFDKNEILEEVKNEQQDIDKPLTREEQKTILNDMLPDKIQYTEKEIEEQIDILDSLKNQKNSEDSQIDFLNQNTPDQTEQEQINLLNKLK